MRRTCARTAGEHLPHDGSRTVATFAVIPSGCPRIPRPARQEPVCVGLNEKGKLSLGKTQPILPSDQTRKQQVPLETGMTGGNADEIRQLIWKIPGERWATGRELLAAPSGGGTPPLTRRGWSGACPLSLQVFSPNVTPPRSIAHQGCGQRGPVESLTEHFTNNTFSSAGSFCSVFRKLIPDKYLIWCLDKYKQDFHRDFVPFGASDFGSASLRSCLPDGFPELA